MSELDRAPSVFWQVVRANHKLQHQTPTIQPRPCSGDIPLTFGQERLWRIDQMQTGITAHNLRAVFRLQGKLDINMLQQSLQEIVCRHDILRTRFPALAGQPVQVIEPDLRVELPDVDLTTLPRAEQEAKLQRIAAAEAQQPFDLAQVPLVRFKLLRLAPDETILVRTIHHIINDRWSDSVFLNELAALYAAFARAEASPLPALPIQYADFACFQREWLQGEVFEAQMDYWREQLSGRLLPLALPQDAAGTAGPGYHGSAQYVTIAADVCDALKQLAAQSGVSFFVVLLAAFKALLHQYSGQQELSLCVPVAGRNRPETRKLIGYFNNLVLLRTAWEGDPDFHDLIKRVGQVTSGAFAHQALPLQQIADHLSIPGALLTRAMFTLQNVPAPPTEMAGVKITPLDMPEGISNFDLSLSLKMQGGDLLGVLRYKTNLFQAAAMTRLLEHFQSLLASLAANPAQHLSELPRLGEQCRVHSVGQAAAAGVYVAPQTEMEHTVATLWQEVLHLERVSIDANFFELGGRSLDLVQVGTRLHTLLNLEISLQDLFQQSTIRLLAHYLARKQDSSQSFARHTQQRTQDKRKALQRQKAQMQRRRKSDG